MHQEAPPSGKIKSVSANPSEIPQRISPCAGAVIPDDSQRILAIQRRDNGLWALPTGHVEPGETVSAAVVREIGEETGLKVRIERLVGLYSDSATQVLRVAGGRREHFVTACFLCRLIGGTLELQPEEVRDAGFFPPGEIPSPRVESHMAWIRAALAGGAPVVE